MCYGITLLSTEIRLKAESKSFQWANFNNVIGWRKKFTGKSRKFSSHSIGQGWIYWVGGAGGCTSLLALAGGVQGMQFFITGQKNNGDIMKCSNLKYSNMILVN